MEPSSTYQGSTLGVASREPGTDREEAWRPHAELSPEAVRYLEFAEREPRARDARSFELLHAENPSAKYAPQPWPTLVGEELVQHLAQVNRAVAALIRGVPSRLLENDPRRLADFYGIDAQRAQLLTMALAKPGNLESLIGRGDFVLGPSGLQCVEYNLSGNIGGFEIALWEDLYRRVPILHRFFDEAGVRFRVTRSVASLWRHLWRRAQRKASLRDGAFNVVIGASEADAINSTAVQFASRELQGVLAEQAPGTQGEVWVCDFGDLERRSSRLFLGERRIHAVMGHGSALTRDLFIAWLDDGVDLYNGALDRVVLPDKRNLALLSEGADSGVFDEAERRIIEEHIPWTRRLEAVETSFRGESGSLPEVVLSAREELVLKPALGRSGQGVHLGASTPPEEWQRLVAAALDSGDWLVQERVASFPFRYLADPEGATEHDLVWGLFDWDGPGFHGGYVRMLPRVRGGVVNVARGATTGLAFEVDREDESSP